jgi:hypothetical protein
MKLNERIENVALLTVPPLELAVAFHTIDVSKLPLPCSMTLDLLASIITFSLPYPNNHPQIFNYKLYVCY